MFIKKFWNKKKDSKNITNNNILVASLLVHAAKIDDSYTDYEKKIILKALIDLKLTTPDESEKLLINELVLRKKNKLPPFLRLIAIIISAKSRSISLQGAREIKTKLNNINDLEVLGPVDSPLLKIKKNFRSRLLIRFNNRSLMQKKIARVLNGLKISSKIKLTVDVDPINFS